MVQGLIGKCRAWAAGRLKAPDWRKGSSTVVVYMSFMWIIVVSAVLFAEYYRAFTHIGKAQVYADLTADGSAFMGNNGWGLDEEDARAAQRKLEGYNSSNFDDTDVDISFSRTDTASRENDTVDATAKLRSRIGATGVALNRSKRASTQITYSGGLRIVLEAWRHTYQFFRSSNGQTRYVLGAGHGNDYEWEQFADCSSFVSGVYRKCGYDIPNWACTWNLQEMGDLVGVGYSALENARPGDIILYWWNNASGPSAHTGIYAGKHDGTHYQVHCSGGSANTYANPGYGASGGAILAPVSGGAAKIMVRRVVDTKGIAYETPDGTIPGLSKNESTIYNVLASCGIGKAAIAGIMGNWRCEGASSPIAREGHIFESDPWNTAYAQRLRLGQISKISFVYEGRGRMGHAGSEGYGIAQWTTTDWSNPMADRKAALWDYTNGKVYDLMMQVYFAVSEMPRVWPGSAEGAPAQYAAASYQDFLGCASPGDAARMFLAHYEGVWNGTDGARAAAAEAVYSIIRNLP